MPSVVVLNASFEPLGVVPVRRALAYIRQGRAVAIDVVDGETLRHANGEIGVPLVVQFQEVVPTGHMDHNLPWSRRGVLIRDAFVCAYCGHFGNTIDHIVPQSRQGENTFMNTVAACKSCNNTKADRTPEEAGMPLLFEPREVTKRDAVAYAVARLDVDYAALLDGAAHMSDTPATATQMRTVTPVPRIGEV